MTLPDAQPFARPIQTTRTFEAAIDHIIEGIERRRLRAGSPLPKESQLAEQLGISRPTLRQGLHVLQDAGFLRVKPGKGGGIFISSDLVPTARYRGALRSRRRPSSRRSMPAVCWRGPRRSLQCSSQRKRLRRDRANGLAHARTSRRQGRSHEDRRYVPQRGGQGVSERATERVDAGPQQKDGAHPGFLPRRPRQRPSHTRGSRSTARSDAFGRRRDAGPSHS